MGAAPERVSLSVRDVSGGAAFIERLTAGGAGCSDVASTPGDVADVFEAPPAGSRLCWTLEVRPNRTEPSDGTSPLRACREAWSFWAEVDVVVDGEVRTSAGLVALSVPVQCLHGPDDARCRDCEIDRCDAHRFCPCLC
ncbi:MAG: hypothetical protein AAF447_21535 [Myxococcota bacterium]